MTRPALPARVGVLGDLHAEDERLEAALALLRAEGADLILAVGDIVDGPGSVDRTCALLQQAGALAVAGNHERWFLAGSMRDLPDATPSVRADTHAFLASLPRTRRFDTVAGRLLLCHGLGDDDMGSIEPEHAARPGWNLPLDTLVQSGSHDLVVHGHTHRRAVQRVRGLTFVNAGTLYREHQPCVLLADLAAQRAIFFDLGADGRAARAETFELG